MPKKKGTPVKAGTRTKTKRTILSPSTRRVEASRVDDRSALHNERVANMIELGYNANREGRDRDSRMARRSRDPLGIITPENRRGYFYSRSGRTASGDYVPSRQQQEEVSMKEVYFSNSDDERDYQLALEIEDASDLSDGIDYKSGDDEFKVETGETLPYKPNKIKPANRPPSRRPPSRPDRRDVEYEVKTTGKPKVHGSLTSERILKEWRKRHPTASVSAESPSTNNDLISGSITSNRVLKEWEKRNPTPSERVELPRVEMGETLPYKPNKIKPTNRPPSRRPPSRPDRREVEYEVKTTEKPKVHGSLTSERILKEWRKRHLIPPEGLKDWRNPDQVVRLPYTIDMSDFNRSDFISGSNMNKPLQTIQQGDGVPKAYQDHIVPESQISQSAHDREEFIGANPRETTSEIVNGIDRLRNEEYKHDVDRVKDVVEEVEVLSGMNNDSLMNGTDLVDNSDRGQVEEGDYRDSNMRGHSRSGLTRGREARAVQEVNLENMEESLRDFFDEGGEGGAPLSDDIQNIGQRFGQAIDSVRGFSGGFSDVSSVVSEATSGIMDSISGLTSLSSDTGSWYSRDSDLDDNIEVSDRMSQINRVPMNKNMRDAVGKFNPMANAGNSLMMSQGVSLGTINEMRKNEVKYKQPNRKFKNTAVDLIRLGNRTKIMLDNEYAP